MVLNGPITSTADSAIVNNGVLSHTSANGTVLSIAITNNGHFNNAGNLTINGQFLCAAGGVINTEASSVFVSFVHV
jgi:hypothetical protein